MHSFAYLIFISAYNEVHKVLFLALILMIINAISPKPCLLLYNILY